MAEEKKNVKLNNNSNKKEISEAQVVDTIKEYHDQATQDIAATKMIRTAESLLIGNCDTELGEKIVHRELLNILAEYLESNNYDILTQLYFRLNSRRRIRFS
jgi:hypothetical protein